MADIIECLFERRLCAYVLAPSLQLDGGKESITRLRAQLQDMTIQQDGDDFRADRTIVNIVSVKESIRKVRCPA